MHNRVKGIADFYWLWPVFLSYLILSRAVDPRGTMFYRAEEENFFPSIGSKGYLRGDWGWGERTGDLE